MLKSKIIIIISLFTLLILMGGCANSVEQTIYLGNTEIYAPITPPPLHINTTPEEGALMISPKFIFNTVKNVNGKSENHYEPGKIPGDTMNFAVKEKNLTWNFPEILMGFDIDLAITNSFGFFGGVNYTNVKQKDLWGGNFGLGLFKKGENSVIRLDAGFIYQQYYYAAETIIHTKEKFGDKKEYISLFVDYDKQVNINPFFTFTINTIDNQSPFNYFFSMGYFTQNLLGFEPGKSNSRVPFSYNPNVVTKDLRADCTAAFLLLNPGISYRFDKNVNLNINAKILKEFQIESASQSWFISPSIQIDWEF